MNMLKKAWGALSPEFLGGDVIATVGCVQGEPAMGTTADLQKSTGEIRVHLVRTPQDSPIVTIELVQEQVPGDGAALTCVRLSLAEAARLREMLTQVDEDAVQQANASDGASPRH